MGHHVSMQTCLCGPLLFAPKEHKFSVQQSSICDKGYLYRRLDYTLALGDEEFWQESDEVWFIKRNQGLLQA